MKVLIVGANGQLGSALVASTPVGIQAAATRRAELNLVDASAIAEIVAREKPEVVLNAAAYTAVDQAETDKDVAYAVNAAAPHALALACRAVGARLVHVSTDYVFDGHGARPYRPEDPVNPLGVYGASKLEGERKIAACEGLDWVIVRTAWVYAPEGRNFVRTMLRLFGERDRVTVVSDQIGSPTSAASLAQCLWSIAERPQVRGILHFTNAGVASWYDFAVAIYEEGKALGLVSRAVDIAPIATEDYKTPAQRPLYTVMDKREIATALQLQLTHWRVELRKVLGAIASA